jgi:hypothetical protein
MTPAECLRLLGLPEVTNVEQIKHAYRLLANQVHPDKHDGDQQSQKRFIEVSQAYRTLVNAARAVEQGKSVGVCCDCREFGEVKVGLDGRSRCGRCIFRPIGGRLLPLPVYVVAKCTVTIVLLVVGGYLLLSALATQSTTTGIAAVVAGLLGMASLAYTSLSIVQCISPRDRIRGRTGKRR